MKPNSVSREANQLKGYHMHGNHLIIPSCVFVQKAVG